MAPGIVDADEWIQLDDIVWVCDEQYKKPLAVGTALMTGPEMKLATAGKAVKLIHYIGDTLWNQTKEFL
jgi:PUA domain protein